MEGLNKPAPTGISDARAIEARVLQIVDRLRAATVGVIVGDTQGSGVIVSEDGLVLTAAHVVNTRGRRVTVVLPDGRKLAGRALGSNIGGDGAMVQISEPGRFATCKMSDLRDLRVGDWCLATGHPGGYQSGRTPVVRLGRIVAMRDGFLQSDCPLLPGDSGGPLFDLNGNVIAIHSRIGAAATLNLHVSNALFLRDWGRLTKTSEGIAQRPSIGGVVGLNGRDDPRGFRVTAIFPGLPAQDAGLRAGDIVTACDGHALVNFEEFRSRLRAHRPGDTVSVHVMRGARTLDLQMILAPPGEE